MLLQLGQEINFLEMLQADRTPTWFLEGKYHKQLEIYQDNKPPKIASELKLQALHLRSEPISASFLSKETFHKIHSQGWGVVSEKFIGEKGGQLNLGSSRHALIYKMQLKGCGRNSLAHRMDYSHAWGGVEKNEAIYSYLMSFLLNDSLPLGALRVPYVFQYIETQKKWGRDNICCTVREADSYRLAQVHSNAISENEKKVLLEHLQWKIPGQSWETRKKALLFQYFSFFFLNFHHNSMNSENALLDGSVIDCESIGQLGDLDKQAIVLDFYPKQSELLHFDEVKEMSDETLLRNLLSQENFSFYQSNLHSIMRAYERTIERWKLVVDDIASDENIWEIFCYFEKVIGEKLFSEKKGLDSLFKKLLNVSCQYQTQLPRIEGEQLLLEEWWNLVSREILNFEYVIERPHYSGGVNYNIRIILKFCRGEKNIEHPFWKINNLPSAGYDSLFLKAMTLSKMDIQDYSSFVNKLIAKGSFFYPWAIDQDGHIVEAKRTKESWIEGIKKEVEVLKSKESPVFSFWDESLSFKSISLNQIDSLDNFIPCLIEGESQELAHFVWPLKKEIVGKLAL